MTATPVVPPLSLFFWPDYKGHSFEGEKNQTKSLTQIHTYRATHPPFVIHDLINKLKEAEAASEQ